MIPKYLFDKRKGIQGLMMWIGILSIIMTLYALSLNKWPEAVSSLGVAAAIISAMLAFEVVHQSYVNQLPQIILKIDGESRYGILQLVIQNIGGSTAFNIRFTWLEEFGDPKRIYNKPKLIYGGFVAIHKESEFNRIVALQKGESHFIVIDGYNQFYENNPTPTNYIARIEFSDQLEEGSYFSYDIPLSMEEFRTTLDHTKESTKANYSITLIPKKLDALTSKLEEIKRELSKNNLGNNE